MSARTGWTLAAAAKTYDVPVEELEQAVMRGEIKASNPKRDDGRGILIKDKHLLPWLFERLALIRGGSL